MSSYAPKLLLATLATVLVCASGVHAAPDFGDNSSEWANDGECDDPRFVETADGYGMAEMLLDEDIGADANDCRALYNSGAIRLQGEEPAAKSSVGLCENVQFGDNSSEWANDGECDDPRFVETSNGYGMAEFLLNEDAFHDMNDCRALCNAGAIELKTE